MKKSESSDNFEKKQKRLQLAFKTFNSKITKSGARLVLERFQIREFDTIVEANWELAQDWFNLFTTLPTNRRSAVRNLGLLLAHALARRNPEKAVRLYNALEESESIVRFTYGRSGITLDAMVIWSANEHSEINNIRFRRLDTRENDDEIAQEVLAALRNDKENLLREYIEIQLKKGEPSNIARALMVAGFSNCNKFNDRVLATFKGAHGFIGEAQSAAMYAYERNIWSEHWFTLMRETQNPEDFWRYSVLLTKIVDGRFDVWGAMAVTNVREPYRMFSPSFQHQLKHRYQKWRGERKKNLFGNAAPSEIFL